MASSSLGKDTLRCRFCKGLVSEFSFQKYQLLWFYNPVKPSCFSCFLLGPGPFPAIIDLYGSGGGLVEYRASLLASRGFVTLALAFLAFEDLPDFPEFIDLDYFGEAIKFLQKEQKVPSKLRSWELGGGLSIEQEISWCFHS